MSPYHGGGNTIFWLMVVASPAIMVGNEVAPVFMRNCNETVNPWLVQFVLDRRVNDER